MIWAWILFSIVIGFIGSDRKVGFWGGFLWSLLLSPLIGLIITVISPTNSEVRRKKETFKMQKEQLELSKNQVTNSTSIADELKKLSDLKSSGVLSEEEYTLAKNKLIK